MGSLPGSAKVFLAAVWVAAAGVLALGPRPLTADGDPSLWLVPTLVAFALARMRSVDLSHTTKISLCCAVAFCLLLISGPAIALWAALLGTLLAAFVPRWRCRCKWYQHLFNAANYVLAVGASWLAYSAFPAAYPLATTLDNALAILLAVVAFYSVNIGLLATIVALAQKQDTLTTWLQRFQEAALPYGGLLLASAGFAIVASYSAVASLVMLFPLATVYLALRSALAIRQETKRALEELAQEVDNRDPYTAEHSRRVASFVERIARAMPQLSSAQVDLIIRTAQVHDVGKLGMPLDVLHKPGALADEEWTLLKRHPVVGADLVSRFSDYRAGRELILHHHERYDGTGYPSGLTADAIPLGARIIAVADAFDAMTSDRSYRRAMTPERAALELVQQSGRQFDPEVVRVFLHEMQPVFAQNRARAASSVPAAFGDLREVRAAG